MNKRPILFLLFALVMVLILVSCKDPTSGVRKTTALNQEKPEEVEFLIKGSIGHSSQNWVERTLRRGTPVLLSNSYLFQVMKGISQQNQKVAEEDLLIPLLRKTLQGLVNASSNGDTRRLFGVPLLILLGDASGLDVPKQIADQAKEIAGNPLFRPRGHYTDSEELKRYFVAMQYLSKAVIDVSIRPEYFPFPREMLFPFDTVHMVRRIFGDPQNKDLLQNWMLIHSFYSDVNGTSDLPTFADVIQAFEKEPTKEDIKEWSRARNLQVLNPEMGLGIQPFGERVSLHQQVIDKFKRRVFKDDTPREQISEILRFSKLLAGWHHDNTDITGIAQRVKGLRSGDYYATAIHAIGLGAKGWETNVDRRNLFAASLTSLAEQTALMSKTSFLVQKSGPDVAVISEGLQLYFEPDSEKYLLALVKASDQMVRSCRRVKDAVPKAWGRDVNFKDSGEAFRAFAKLAKNSKPLITHGPLWKSYGNLLTRLARDPSVAVDVFRLKDRSGRNSFYTWAIAPFEVVYRLNRSVAPSSGMVMVFFEGWSDEIIHDAVGPLNNLQWQGRILEGYLEKLQSILPLPHVKKER